VKQHAFSVAAAAGRPYQYLSGPTRKEDLARQIAERDGLAEGLVCVFSVLEPCRTFSLVWKDASPFVRPAQRKCLHLYFYFLDRQLGLIHVKLQTWFTFPLQVYVNGHEWLARRLARHGVRYCKRDNAFVHVSDLERAQKLADGFASVDWERVLGRYARRVNPLLRDLLAPMQYYWVTTQSEYSTDVLFRSREDLEELMPRLLTYSTLYFEARDVLAFLGRKLTGNFLGEVVTDQVDFSQMPKRLPGRRVKHRMKRNWMKMYNKEGAVLRVETVLNDPTEFCIRRRVRRHGRSVMAWSPCARASPFCGAIKRSAGSATVAISTRWRPSTTPRPPFARSTPSVREPRRPTVAACARQPHGAPGAHAVRGFDERRTCLAWLYQPRAAREARTGSVPARGRLGQALGSGDTTVAPAAPPPVDRQDPPFTPLACLAGWTPCDGSSHQAA
jgi:hypothetical protein